ncbi:flavin-containing monooxygenase FMO GS-OX5-like protein [Tanacetum coccineum]
MTTSLKVPVIGADFARLTTARDLQRESHQVVVFEKSHRIGGTWAYDPRVQSDLLGLDLNRDIRQGSLYKSMRTNLPRELMSFTDFKFSEKVYDDPRTYPGHEEVLMFLEDFARNFELTKLIRFSTAGHLCLIKDQNGYSDLEMGITRLVLFSGKEIWFHGLRQIRWLTIFPHGTHMSFTDFKFSEKVYDDPRTEFEVEWETNRVSLVKVFDAVVVCNGHNSQPRLAIDIPVVAVSNGLKDVPDGLQIVFNYDVNVDIRWCSRRNFVLKDEVCFQAKLEKMKKEYEKIIKPYYNKQAGGLDEGAYRASQQPVHGSPAPNQFEAAGPFGMSAPAGQMTLFQANPSSV